MSDFTVVRSLDGYCLVLDNKRIAGGKPDYRGENVLVDWTTEVAYGPVDDLVAENAKLWELVRDMYACIEALCSMVENSPGCSMCPTNQDEERACASADVYCRMRELGVEV